MAFRKTGLCRLIILALTLCMLTGAVSAALGESQMTEEQLDEMLEDRQKYVDEYSWDVSAKNIERYRAEADQIQVAGYLGIDLNSESSEQMQNLIQQYLDGAVDGQGFLRQLDQMYRMMMMAHARTRPRSPPMIPFFFMLGAMGDSGSCP